MRKWSYEQEECYTYKMDVKSKENNIVLDINTEEDRAPETIMTCFDISEASDIVAVGSKVGELRVL